ncbi:MAG: phosphatidic acid phosphatase [Bacillota bacterium]|nr:phosphatidic acid phosphatase [Bacillota bacterium]
MKTNGLLVLDEQRRVKFMEFFKKYNHMFYAVAGWLIFIALFFSLKHLIKPRFFIHSKLDDQIPFVKEFFIVYCTWYLYLFVSLLYFGLRSKTDFTKLQAYLFTGMGICLLVFIVYPNAIDFRPVVQQTDLLSRMIAYMFSFDVSTMVTPSMHVFASVSVHLSLYTSRLTKNNKVLLIFSFILMSLICASTVFIKQHSVIDVFWGIVLALILYFPVYGFSNFKTAVKNHFKL